MRQLFILTASLPLLFFINSGDELSTKTGKVSFASLAENHADINAVSRAGSCLIDKKTGEIEFTVTINDFKFEEPGLQEIFSRQVMQSDQYPTAGFKGLVADFQAVDFAKNGDYPLVVNGTLTMHGVSKDIKTPCLIKIKGNTVQAMAEFQVNMRDYKIENPIDNDNIKITIDCLLGKN
jgi:polyisoprenoid-binding protein YceI